MIRNTLDRTYRVCGYLSGFFLVSILLAILAQVAGRWLKIPIDMIESSGFCMAASCFFGLAYSLRLGSHIRVTLLVRNFRAPVRRFAELWCCTVGIVVGGYLSYNAIVFNYQSYMFGSKTLGLIAFGVWIPQVAFSLGTAAFTIAFIDEFIGVLRGDVPNYERNAPLESGSE